MTLFVIRIQFDLLTIWLIKMENFRVYHEFLFQWMEKFCFFLLNSKTFFYSLSSITSIYVDVKNLKWIPCFASQQHVFIEMDVK